MFLTKHQKKVLDAQTPRAAYGSTPSERLGISDNAIDSVNTDVFANFKEAMELMANPDYFQIFEGRIKRHFETLWEATRLVRANMKEVSR